MTATATSSASLSQTGNDAFDQGGTLTGVRVVDFGHFLPGPLLGMFLADNGADVISIVPPGGPRWDHPINAALFRNKRVIELDLKSAEGQARARDLIDTADVVIENFRPGVMKRLGLDPIAARERRPELTWCSLPAFPADHDLASMRGWDAIVGASVGLYPPKMMVLRGGPRFSALAYPSVFAALLAAHRTIAALIYRQRTGKGAHVEVSLYEAAFQTIGTNAEVPDSRTVSHPILDRLYSILQTVYQTSDGSWILIGGTPLRGAQSFLDRYLPGFDLVNMSDGDLERLRSELPRLLKTRTAAEWEKIAQEEHGAIFGIVLATEQWLHDEHALASETVVPVTDSELGETVQVGFPVWLSDAKPRIRWGRGGEPETTEDTWADSSSAFPDSVPDAEAPASALSGIRVVDASILLASPDSTRILAQYGADVISIANARLAYENADPMADDYYIFYGHRSANSGKRSILVDLKLPQGQQILRDLIRTADVVHHNYRRASASRINIGVEEVRAVNPAAILSTVTQHSYGGFRENYRGHDILGQMSAGIAERFGGDVPEIAPFLLNDYGAGHLCAFGVMLALFHRNRTGQVLQVNSSLSRTSTVHQMPFMIDFEGATRDEPRGKNSLGWSAESRFYECSDGWIYLDNTSNETSLAEVIGCSTEEGESIETQIASRLAAMSVDDAASTLTAGGCAAVRYVEVPDSVTSEYALSHNLTAIAEHRGLGYGFGISHPSFLGDGSRSATSLTSTRPGSETIEVLTELGLRDQVADLLESHAIATGQGELMTSTTAVGYWTSPVIERDAHMQESDVTRIAQDIAKAVSLSGSGRVRLT